MDTKLKRNPSLTILKRQDDFTPTSNLSTTVPETQLISIPKEEYAQFLAYQ